MVTITLIASCLGSVLLAIYFAKYRHAFKKETERLSLLAIENKKELLNFLNNCNRAMSPENYTDNDFSNTAPNSDIKFSAHIPETKSFNFSDLGLADISLNIADAFTYYSAINSDFVNGVGMRANQAFEHSDLGEYLRSLASNKSSLWMFKGINEEYYEGVNNNLKGYVGEQFLGRHFENAGHEVDFPSSGQNPGFDFVVDGQEFQVKTVKSFAEVSKHLDKYPNTPVFVSGDCEGIPDDILHIKVEDLSNLDISDIAHEDVIAVDGFSHLDAADNASDGVDGVLGTGNYLNVPYTTLLLSSLREVKLLTNDRTDIETSIKNIILDATGTAGGAALGAKTGAVIGTMIAPGLGTAIGGACGAIFGGIAGRAATNSIKTADAEQATENEKNISKNTAKVMNENLREMKRKIAGETNKTKDKWLAKRYEVVCKAKTIKDQHNKNHEINQVKLSAYIMDKMKKSLSNIQKNSVSIFLWSYFNPIRLGVKNAKLAVYEKNLLKAQSLKLVDVIEAAICIEISLDVLKDGLSLLYKNNLAHEKLTTKKIKQEMQMFHNYSIQLSKELDKEIGEIHKLHIGRIEHQLKLNIKAVKKAILEWGKLDQDKMVNAYKARHSTILNIADKLSVNQQMKKVA